MNKNDLTRMFLSGVSPDKIDEVIDDMDADEEADRRLSRERKREIARAKAAKNKGRTDE